MRKTDIELHSTYLKETLSSELRLHGITANLNIGDKESREDNADWI